VTHRPRVWVTRAEPGASETAARLAALGYAPIAAPLLTVEWLAPELALDGAGALAFTSRNGVEAFAGRPDVPVFAVGDATAALARDAGFADVRSAGGDLHALAALIRAEGRGLSILHPAAAEPAGDLAALVGDAARVTTAAVYETVETDATAPEVWDAVLIHSPRAARALAARLPSGPARGRIAVAISEAAAAPLTSRGFAEVRVAETPTEASLLAALGKRGVNV
jgi:uroporphyrinogen-III synthase